MACDDLVFDLVVSGLGQDASGDELVLGRVGPSIDDALRVGVADPGEGLELVGCGGIDVQGRSRSSGGSRGRLGCCLCKVDHGGDSKKQGGSEQLAVNVEHLRFSLWGWIPYCGRVRERAERVNAQVFAVQNCVNVCRRFAWRVDFSKLESYPEIQMSTLHFHHGHHHHHAESVLAAVSGVAK